MNSRMAQHQLTAEEISKVLSISKTGHLGTNDRDGYPYVVPVHFTYQNDSILIHGLNNGQKITNIQANNKVCFEVAKMEDLILNDKACDVNTKYQSVIIKGTAELINDKDEKIEALHLIVKKYTPHLAGQTYPDTMIEATGIIKITVNTITGKYYKYYSFGDNVYSYVHYKGLEYVRMIKIIPEYSNRYTVYL